MVKACEVIEKFPNVYKKINADCLALVHVKHSCREESDCELLKNMDSKY